MTNVEKVVEYLKEQGLSEAEAAEVVKNYKISEQFPFSQDTWKIKEIYNAQYWAEDRIESFCSDDVAQELLKEKWEEYVESYINHEGGEGAFFLKETTKRLVIWDENGEI